MLLENLNIKRGLVNGSLGIVRDIEHGLKGTYVGVDFITTNGSTEYERLKPHNEIQENYVLYQIPIKLAYATSVHKVQGMTIQKLLWVIYVSSGAHNSFM